MFRKRSRLLAFLIWCLPLTVAAQQTSQPLHTVRASADATVSAKPDKATVSVSVYSQATTAEAASQQNATATSGVLNALKQVVGSKGQIRTSGFYATPQMQYPKGGGTPKITGYEANNRLSVTVDDMTLVSKVVDSAVSAGASQILGVTFSVKDNEAIHAQALAQATRDAYEAAQTIAKALNLTVVGVLDAQTTANGPPPGFVVGGVAEQRITRAASTPIEPGEVTVYATVTVTLEVR